MNVTRPVPTVLVASVLLAAVGGCGGGSSVPSRLTMANYDRITTGMPRAEVEAFLGLGREQVGGAIGGMSTTVVSWQESDKSITVTFVNDKVATRDEDGL